MDDMTIGQNEPVRGEDKTRALSFCLGLPLRTFTPGAAISMADLDIDNCGADPLSCLDHRARICVQQLDVGLITLRLRRIA